MAAVSVKVEIAVVMVNTRSTDSNTVTDMHMDRSGK